VCPAKNSGKVNARRAAAIVLGRESGESAANATSASDLFFLHQLVLQQSEERGRCVWEIALFFT
jgi:hypothetical protein